MSDPKEPYYVQDDEISLKEVILKIKEFGRELLKKWKILLLFAILGGGIGFAYSYFSKPTYKATLTFMTNEEESGASGLMSLASDFGFGGIKKPALNVDKLAELVQSRRTVQQALLKKKNIAGKEDYLANHILDTYDYRKDWKKNNPELVEFRFTTDEIDDKDTTANKILKILYNNIKEDILKVEVSDADIISLECETFSEGISKYLADELFNGLSSFYVRKSVERQQNTYNLIFQRVDSIKHELDKAERAWAKWQDESHRLVKLQGRLDEIQLRRKVEILNVMYSEAVKNQEITKLNLLEKTPVLQVVDEPGFPILKEEKSILKSGAIGGFLGIFLSGALVVIGKVFNDLMK